MIMVANRIPVAEGYGEQFEERFRQRAGLGFFAKSFNVA
jgi:heme-degrading monooxygenase HmoA